MASEIVEQLSLETSLTAGYPGIPVSHVRVLVAFLLLGSSEVGGRVLDSAEVARGMELLAKIYRQGGLEVRKAGSEWQLWQKGNLALGRWT